jgi:hypothetical protein
MANTARNFLRSHGVDEQDIETVWTAFALHTTPGIPQHMHPVIALVTAGVEMDVLGIAFSEFTDAEREAVLRAHPRPGRFKEEVVQAFYNDRPDTTFSTVNADVIADKDPSFPRKTSVARSEPPPGPAKHRLSRAGCHAPPGFPLGTGSSRLLGVAVLIHELSIVSGHEVIRPKFQ